MVGDEKSERTEWPVGGRGSVPVERAVRPGLCKEPGELAARRVSGAEV